LCQDKKVNGGKAFVDDVLRLKHLIIYFKANAKITFAKKRNRL